MEFNFSNVDEERFKFEWTNLSYFLKESRNKFETKRGAIFLAFYNKHNVVIIPESSNMARFISEYEYKIVYLNDKKLSTDKRQNTTNYPDDVSKNKAYIFSLINRDPNNTWKI